MACNFSEVCRTLTLRNGKFDKVESAIDFLEKIIAIMIIFSDFNPKGLIQTVEFKNYLLRLFAVSVI